MNMNENKKEIWSTCIDSGQLLLIDPCYLTKEQQEILGLKNIKDNNKSTIIKNKNGLNYALLIKNFGGDISAPVILEKNGDITIKLSEDEMEEDNYEYE